MQLLPGNLVDLSAAVIERLELPPCVNGLVALDVLRLDKIHPVISGNKWYKLKYYLGAAGLEGNESLLTFGGGWSNHIIAVACAAAHLGFKSIGLIRGEKPAQLSATLQQASAFGMELIYISREQYSKKEDTVFLAELRGQFGAFQLIPEGGAGETGVRGAEEMLSEQQAAQYTHLICAVGTGTMLAGLARSAPKAQKIVAIPVLKGFDDWQSPFIDERNAHRISVEAGYHFGGYAKKTPALIGFMNSFFRDTGLPTDFVYTGKLFFAILDLIKKEYFPAGSRLLAIHSGGLQGNRSLAPGTLVF